MTKGIGSVQPKLQATVGVNDLNAVALKVGVICRHRPMPEQLASTAHCTSFSFRSHHNNAVLQVKTCVNAGVAKLVNVGAGRDLARGERCEGVKKVVSRNKKLVSTFMALT